MDPAYIQLQTQLYVVTANNTDRSKMAADSREIFKSPLCEGGGGTLVRHEEAWFLLKMFPTADRFDDIRNFSMSDEDIIVASYPKSGSCNRHIRL